MAVGRFFGRSRKEKPEEAAPPGPEASEAPPAEAPAKKEGAFARLRRGLAKTRQALGGILPFGRKLDEDALDEIEMTLIQADFGPVTAMELTEDLRQAYKGKEFAAEEIVPFFKARLAERLGGDPEVRWAEKGPTVIVVTGVNGTGKTTSIAKLAHAFRQQGKSVVLAAGDTFRAAAVEQLGIWSERLGVEMIRGKEGSDPASVVFTALERAEETNADVIIVDTAGRLHTDKNLMAQLSKIGRVIAKKIEGAPHEVLQVLDATTGQNAVQQAKEFHRALEITGLVLTKFDGSARGGVIFPVLQEVGLPVKFVGVGEGIEDLQPFDPASFVEALFEE